MDLQGRVTTLETMNSQLQEIARGKQAEFEKLQGDNRSLTQKFNRCKRKLANKKISVRVAEELLSDPEQPSNAAARAADS
jgi:predicted DNA binding CopG/RHH family protein